MTNRKTILIAVVGLVLATFLIIVAVLYVKKQTIDSGDIANNTAESTPNTGSSPSAPNEGKSTPESAAKAAAPMPQATTGATKKATSTPTSTQTTSPKTTTGSTTSGTVCGTAGYNGSVASLPLFEDKYASYWRTDYSFADIYGATGQTFENFKLPTEMFIKSDNLLIRNFYLSPGSGYYPIRTDNREAGAGTTITNGTIAVTGATDNGPYKGIVADNTNLTISDMDISGTHDGISVGSGSVSISNVCIHDLADTPTAHNDGVEIYGGNGVTIRNSEINNKNSQTSAINITNDYGPINNVLIENVTLSGGGYTIYVRGDGASGGAITNIRFRNVTIAKPGYYGIISYQGAPGAIVEWSVKDSAGNPIPHP